MGFLTDNKYSVGVHSALVLLIFAYALFNVLGDMGVSWFQSRNDAREKPARWSGNWWLNVLVLCALGFLLVTSAYMGYNGYKSSLSQSARAYASAYY